MDVALAPSAHALERRGPWCASIPSVANSNLDLIHFIRDELAASACAAGSPSTRAEEGQPLRDPRRGQAGRSDTFGAHRHRALGRPGVDGSTPLSAGSQGRPPLRPRRADMKRLHRLAVANPGVSWRATRPFAIHFAFSYDEETGCFGVKEPHRRHARSRHRAGGLHRRRADRHGAGASRTRACTATAAACAARRRTPR